MQDLPAVSARENADVILGHPLLHSMSFALLEGRPEPARQPPRRGLFLLGCIAISGERAIGELRMASFSDVVGAPVPVQVPAYM